MSPKQLVRLSNGIGISAIILLLYWVFIFIVIQVFGLKVFKQNITETFYLSVLGILALMIGSLIINIMFNLTRIAENKDGSEKIQYSNKKIYGILIAIFPLIALLLFAGDYLTSNEKEKMLVKSAKSVLTNNIKNTSLLSDYNFNERYLISTGSILEIYSKIDKNFPNVSLIIRDSINDSPVYLGFDQYTNGNLKDTITPSKKDYIYKTNEIERVYLNEVFDGKSDEIRYTKSNGDYELFYPYRKGKKIMILYFSENQRYGKIGS